MHGWWRSCTARATRIFERRNWNVKLFRLTHVDTAVLNSPRYPGSFIEQVIDKHKFKVLSFCLKNQCLWEVRSFDPQARLKIVFDDWSMPLSPSGDCVANYLEIQEHQTFGVSQSVKLCGQNPGFYVSKNDKITLVLRSSAQIQGMLYKTVCNI